MEKAWCSLRLPRAPKVLWLTVPPLPPPKVFVPMFCPCRLGLDTACAACVPWPTEDANCCPRPRLATYAGRGAAHQKSSTGHANDTNLIRCCYAFEGHARMHASSVQHSAVNDQCSVPPADWMSTLDMPVPASALHHDVQIPETARSWSTAVNSTKREKSSLWSC